MGIGGRLLMNRLHRELQIHRLQEKVVMQGINHEPTVSFAKELNLPDSSLQTFKDNLVLKATNEFSCKVLNEKLQARNRDDIKVIFSEVKNNVFALLLDPFGSSVFRNLFDVCDDDQRNQLVSAVTVDIHALRDVCVVSQGSESIKRLIDCCLTSQEQLSNLIRAFQQIIVSLVTNEIGASIIRHFFNIFPVPAAEAEPILKAVDNNIKQIATSKHGSDIVKVIFSVLHRFDGQKSIFLSLMYHFHVYAVDPFGCEVITHLIGMESDIMLYWISDQMEGPVLYFSKNQYGSKVLQKLIEVSPDIWADDIIHKIVNAKDFLKLSVLQNEYVFSVLQLVKKHVMGARLKKVNYLIARRRMWNNKRKNIVRVLIEERYVVIKLSKTRYA